jgi:hypothetical protein
MLFYQTTFTRTNVQNAIVARLLHATQITVHRVHWIPKDVDALAGVPCGEEQVGLASHSTLPPPPSNKRQTLVLAAIATATTSKATTELAAIAFMGSDFRMLVHRSKPGFPGPAAPSPCRYNRYVIRSALIAAAVASIVLLAGCKKDIQNQDAVRQGVMSYLSKRSDLLAMDVSVNSVAFHEDEATAQVHFQAKGNSSPGAGMNMQYVLERKDGQWVVKGRTGANAAHGAAGPPDATPAQGSAPGPLDGMPHTALPSGGGASGLPPGHPAVGGSQGLPPGHPAVPDSNSQK